MMSALVFGTDAGTAAQLQQLCLQTRAACVYRTLERFPQSHETMRLLNSFSPELVFLGSDDEDTARAVECNVRSIQPGTAIVGVSANPDRPAVVESTFGGFSVLTLPCDAHRFRAAIFQALQSRIRQKSAPVFAFQTAKAGSGATTTALVVARTLATLADNRVLVLECDLHSGPISLIHNLRPNYSIMDALEECPGLNDDRWRQMVVDVDGIDVLCSLSRSGVHRVSPWDYQGLLSFVGSRYDVIIADLPEVIDDSTEMVARLAQAVFIVTAPSSPALYLASRRRHELEMRGVAATKVKYIVTRKSGNRPLPRDPGWVIDAEKIAVIPFETGLADACELNIGSVSPAALAEFVKVAEFCCGRRLVRKRSGVRVWLDGWMRGSPRAPELSTVAR